MNKKVETIITILKKLRDIETFNIKEFRDMVGDPDLFKFLTTKGYNDPAEQSITFDLESKLQISLIALEHGEEIEKVCKILTWKEFETFTTNVLEKNNYLCIQNFRLKHNQKRYEVDIIGLKKPLILCVDSKHYKKSGKSHALKKACKKQIERVEALFRELPRYIAKLRIMEWKNANIIPLIVTLLPEEINFFEQVPIVPFFKFNNFIIELQTYISEIYHIQTKIPEYTLLREWNP
ncbi:MAG: nuclease-related domain-containing protein [Candidatus Jordarchaeum sp.]|uniref:nuclease-related domain-containing protein n=1 Tax=Candidatus Jordarchaeum sp. TaxID=2823881 RepID=UPI004049DF51